MDLQEKSRFEDLSSLYHYRAELPNILFTTRLNPFVFKTYCVFKRVADDSGQILKTNGVLCREIGCSFPTLVKSKKELVKMGLIKISKDENSSSKNAGDFIQLVDLNEGREICQ